MAAQTGQTGRARPVALAIGHSTTFVSIAGERIGVHHASVPASGGQAPVVLLHGMASSWRQWRTTMLSVGAQIPVAALDLPGFGFSDQPRRPLAVPDYPEACEAWAVANGWGPLVAIGHSFGGAVLVDWASRYPGRFAALGLVAPAAVFHPWYTGGYDFLRWPVLGPLLVPFFIWLISTATVGRHAFAHIAADLGALDPAEIADLQWGCRRAREMRRALDYYRWPALEAALSTITAPVELLWGTADRVVPYEDAAYYVAHLPRCRLTTLQGCGHVPMLERRGAFDAYLTELWTHGTAAGSGRAAPGA